MLPSLPQQLLECQLPPLHKKHLQCLLFQQQLLYQVPLLTQQLLHNLHLSTLLLPL